MLQEMKMLSLLSEDEPQSKKKRKDEPGKEYAKLGSDRATHQDIAKELGKDRAAAQAEKQAQQSGEDPEIAKILARSTAEPASVGLAQRVEFEAMLKFGLFLFNPPWKVEHELVRALKSKDFSGQAEKGLGELTKQTGPLFDELANKTKEELGPDADPEEFKKKYEENMVDATRSDWFRQAIREFYIDVAGDVKQESRANNVLTRLSETWNATKRLKKSLKLKKAF